MPMGSATIGHLFLAVGYQWQPSALWVAAMTAGGDSAAYDWQWLTVVVRVPRR